MRLSILLLSIFVVFMLSCHDQRIHDEPVKMEPESYFFGQRAYPDGRINQKAVLQAREAILASSAARENEPIWVNVGPDSIGGRISSLDVQKQDDGSYVVYAAAASGGVFKSINSGMSWEPIFDDQAVMGIGFVSISPHDPLTVFVGTGEINGSGSIIYGNGLYKSTDGGENWSHLGFAESGSMGSIAFHPTNPAIMYLSVMGTLYEESDLRGIYRTIDGGENWERVLSANANTGGLRVIVDQQNPDRIYAALWERYRRAYDRAYSGENSGVYRSLDGGDNWTDITPISDELGRIGIAVAPSDGNVLYASVSNANQMLEGVYKSVDAGNNWDELTQEGALSTTGYEWWFNEIAVNPDDPHELHRYSFTVSKLNTDQTDGQWNAIFTNVHVDQHAYWIDPDDTEHIWLGNDGGVYYSDNGGQTNDFRGNMPNNQAYAINVYARDENVRLLGTQDNGTWGTLEGDPNTYTNLFGGDGFRSAFGAGENPPLYIESQYGNIFKIQDGTYLAVDVPVGQYNWNTPIIVHPTEQNTMLFGGERVYRTTNAGQSSVAISPDLEGPNPPVGGLVFNTIYTLAMSSVDNDIIWAGLDNGRLWITEDDGENWTDVSESLPKRWCTSVITHPTEALTAYVTFSGFTWGEDTSHVYKTIDGGENWLALGTDLPDVPVNEIIIDTATLDLYLATDVGVFKSIDDGQSWSPFGQGMPSVVVRDLDLHFGTRQLFAGTYGRSIFKAQLEEPSFNEDHVAQKWALSIGPNPTRGQLTIRGNMVQTGPVQVSWFDNNGRLLEKRRYEQAAGAFQLTTQVPASVSGNYILRVEGEAGVSSQTIILH